MIFICTVGITICLVILMKDFLKYIRGIRLINSINRTLRNWS